MSHWITINSFMTFTINAQSHGLFSKQPFFCSEKCQENVAYTYTAQKQSDYRSSFICSWSNRCLEQKDDCLPTVLDHSGQWSSYTDRSNDQSFQRPTRVIDVAWHTIRPSVSGLQLSTKSCNVTSDSSRSSVFPPDVSTANVCSKGND